MIGQATKNKIKRLEDLITQVAQDQGKLRQQVAAMEKRQKDLLISVRDYLTSIIEAV